MQLQQLEIHSVKAAQPKAFQHKQQPSAPSATAQTPGSATAANIQQQQRGTRYLVTATLTETCKVCQAKHLLSSSTNRYKAEFLVVYCPTTATAAAPNGAAEVVQNAAGSKVSDSSDGPLQSLMSRFGFGWSGGSLGDGGKQGGEGAGGWRLLTAPGLGPLLLDAAPY